MILSKFLHLCDPVSPFEYRAHKTYFIELLGGINVIAYIKHPAQQTFENISSLTMKCCDAGPPISLGGPYSFIQKYFLNTNRHKYCASIRNVMMTKTLR